MLQRCTARSCFIPVATLPNVKHRAQEQGSLSSPSALSLCSRGVAALRSRGPLAGSCCLDLVSFRSLSRRGFILHFCICFILHANGKGRGSRSETGLSAFNSVPDAGSGCTVLYKSFCHLGTGNTKPTASPAQDRPSHVHLLYISFPYNKGCRSLLAFPESRVPRRKKGTRLGLSATAKALVKCRDRRTSSRLPDSAPQGRGSVAPLSPITLQPACKKIISPPGKGLAQQLYLLRDSGGVFNTKKTKNILSRKQQNSGNAAEELCAMSCPCSGSSKQLSNFPEALLG